MNVQKPAEHVLFSFLRGRLRTRVFFLLFFRQHAKFSFLRGRLRTCMRAKISYYSTYQFSFLRGRLRTYNGQKASRLLICSFHSFEVGFGRKTKNEKKGEEASAVFVSFFRKQTRNMGLRRFPDFEVGFGRKKKNGKRVKKRTQYS